MVWRRIVSIRALASLTVAVFVCGLICCSQDKQEKQDKDVAWTGGTPNWKEPVTMPACGPFALSPDGAFAAFSVNIYRRADEDGTNAVAGRMIEVREVKSGKLIAAYTSPRLGWGSSSTRPVQYCDGGKYLLVFDGIRGFFVLDTATYQEHGHIDPEAGEGHRPSVRTATGSESSPGASASSYLSSACAANGSTAVFLSYSEPGLSGPTTAGAFDLDTGQQIPGTANAPGIVNSAASFAAQLAVSASGSRMAIASEGRVSVFDLRARPVSQIASFYDDDISKRHPGIAFAEESVVAVWNAERDFKPVIRFWDVGTASQIQALGDSSQDTYGDFHLSGDGRTVLGYSEKRVSLDPGGPCRSSQVRSSLAHFTLWDRPSGKIIAQSPALKVGHNYQANFPGGCHTESEEGPELDISQNGKTVAADCVSSMFDQLPMQVFTLK